jgi:hypothetical protein
MITSGWNWMKQRRHPGPTGELMVPARQRTNGLTLLKFLSPYSRVEAETMARQSGIATRFILKTSDGYGGSSFGSIGNWVTNETANTATMIPPADSTGEFRFIWQRAGAKCRRR